MKRLLSILLALCMALTLLPAAALAEGRSDTGAMEPVRQEQAEERGVVTPDQITQDAQSTARSGVSAPESATLPEAENGVITLTQDVRLATAFPVANDTTLKLDLNGYTLTGPDGQYGYTIDNSGTLTIVDGSDGKTGKIAAATVSSATVRNNGIMELDGVTVESAFIALKSEENTTLTVKDCLLSTSANYDAGCCLQNWGNATVSGTTMKGSMGIMAVSYTSGGTAYSSTLTLTDCAVPDAVVSLDSGRYDETTSTQTVTISGGSYAGVVRVSAGSIMDIKDAASIGAAIVSNSVSYSLGTQVHDSTGPSHVTITGDVMVDQLTASAKVGNSYYSSINDAIGSANFDGTVTLCGDVVEDVVITQNKTVTMDLNGHKLESSRSDAITNRGTLTVRGPGTVQCDLAGKSSLLNDVGGMATLDGGSFVKELNASNNDYYVLTNHGTRLTLNDGVAVTSTSTHSSAIENGWYTSTANVGGATSELIINGGSVSASGGLYTIKNDDYGKLTINGGTFTNTAPENGTVLNWNDCTITGGTFNAANCSVATMAEGNLGAPAHPYEQGKTTISGGYFKGSLGTHTDFRAAIAVSVSGGYFSADPSAYVAVGKAAVANDDAAYPFTVGVKGAQAAEVVSAPPAVADKLPETATAEEKSLASAAAAALQSESSPAEVSRDILTAAARTVANDNTVTKADVLDEVKALDGNSSLTEAAVAIVVQPYLDIQIKDVAVGAGSKALTLDITPMYKTIATTQAVMDGNTAIKTEGTGKNAVVVPGQTGTLRVSQPVAVVIPLPAGFAENGTLYIKHEKGGGRAYIYEGTVTSNVLTFTNPNGFSTFTFSAANPAEAQIGSTNYATLQDAVDAVTDGQTIKALADGSAAVSGNMTFTVDTNGHAVALTAASGYDLSQTQNGDVISCTVSVHHSSGGGSTTSTYAVTVEKVEGGGVTASRTRAAKGATITLTVKPEDGCELAELTAADAKGNALKLTEKGGKYIFTMPASAVTVKAIFRTVAEQRETALPFTDVSADAWYHDAVQFVYGKGMMTGTSETAFSPDTIVSRGMIVTILYRMEGCPSNPGESTAFADVATSRYDSDAIAWASAKGVVTGYSDGRFGPDDPITREQLAAVLYRFAEDPETAGMVLSEFTDADQVSSYAVDAMRWAVGNGLFVGNGGQVLDPTGTATRSQAAVLLMRFYELTAQ